MKTVKIKVLEKKPLQIDLNWFPYRDIVNEGEFDNACRAIAMYMEKYGINKVRVSYEVIDIDNKSKPKKILVECKVKTGFLKEIESNYIFRCNPK